jgi:pseudaminic acid synthase
MNTNKTFIIAELSANHGSDINIAKKTILAAKQCGADAIKIQTYTADTITLNCDNEYFKINQGTIWDGQTLYDLYKDAYMPWEWQPELKKYADEVGITFFSSPFDKTAVDFLEKMNVPIYKIASFEITDIPLIEYTASKGKPIIISTGIATEEEIHDAIDACKSVGNEQITLLKCTSQYPAKPKDANIATMVDMKTRFGVKVGLSDHTMGSDVAVVAASLGATVVEKHFIIDRKIGGPDASFSMTPDEFSEMVEKIRNVEKMLGTVDYSVTESKEKSRHFSRSLFVVKDVKAGDVITEDNVRSIRPGLGLAPKFFKDIIGKKFKSSIEKGTPLLSNMFTLSND